MRITNTKMRNSKPGKANPVTLGLLFMVFGGIVFLVWGLPPLKYSKASANWPSVQGTITKSEIETWRREGKSYYQPDIVYTYEVNSKKFTSSKVTVGNPPSDSNMSPAKRLQNEYPVGKKVDVYYDPEAPASSALKPGIQKNDLLLAFITGVFPLMGILLFFNGVSKNLKQRNYGYEEKLES
jgi:hypothetical protein